MTATHIKEVLKLSGTYSLFLFISCYGNTTGEKESVAISTTISLSDSSLILTTAQDTATSNINSPIPTYPFGDSLILSDYFLTGWGDHEEREENPKLDEIDSSVVATFRKLNFSKDILATPTYRQYRILSTDRHDLCQCQIADNIDKFQFKYQLEDIFDYNVYYAFTNKTNSTTCEMRCFETGCIVLIDKNNDTAIFIPAYHLGSVSCCGDYMFFYMKSNGQISLVETSVFEGDFKYVWKKDIIINRYGGIDILEK